MKRVSLPPYSIPHHLRDNHYLYIPVSLPEVLYLYRSRQVGCTHKHILSHKQKHSIHTVLDFGLFFNLMNLGEYFIYVDKLTDIQWRAASSHF